MVCLLCYTQLHKGIYSRNNMQENISRTLPYNGRLPTKGALSLPTGVTPEEERAIRTLYSIVMSEVFTMASYAEQKVAFPYMKQLFSKIKVFENNGELNAMFGKGQRPDMGRYHEILMSYFTYLKATPECKAFNTPMYGLDDLRKSIPCGAVEPLESLNHEYQTKLHKLAPTLRQCDIHGWKRVRGDGHCYYRAVMLGNLEQILASDNPERAQKLTNLANRLEASLEVTEPRAIVIPDDKVGLQAELILKLREAAAGHRWVTLQDYEKDLLSGDNQLDRALITSARYLMAQALLLTPRGKEAQENSLVFEESSEGRIFRDIHHYIDGMITYFDSEGRGEDARGAPLYADVLGGALGINVRVIQFAGPPIEQEPDRKIRNGFTVDVLKTDNHYQQLYRGEIYRKVLRARAEGNTSIQSPLDDFKHRIDTLGEDNAQTRFNDILRDFFHFREDESNGFTENRKVELTESFVQYCLRDYDPDNALQNMMLAEFIERPTFSPHLPNLEENHRKVTVNQSQVILQKPNSSFIMDMWSAMNFRQASSLKKAAIAVAGLGLVYSLYVAVVKNPISSALALASGIVSYNIFSKKESDHKANDEKNNAPKL